MKKKNKLVVILMAVLILSIGNVFLFVNKGDVSYDGFSGRFVENLPKLPLNLNLSLIAFVIQWIVLIIIAVVAYTKFVKHKKQESLTGHYRQILKHKGRFETDFDIFYKLLKEKKKLRIGLIATSFKITKEQALDWGKILESNDLVSIEYPAFSEPEVKIIEKEVKDKKDGETKEEGEGEKEGKKEIEEKVEGEGEKEGKKEIEEKHSKENAIERKKIKKEISRKEKRVKKGRDNK